MASRKILVEHLTRVEGHGNILASEEGGRIAEAIFQIVEGIRFFEGILRARSFEEVAHIASRICGICAVSHTCASLMATEKALGIEVSAQTRLLRRLIMNGEVMSSHALHVYFLALPDLLHLPSVLPLIKRDPEMLKRAFRVKTAAYELGKTIGGRHTHPISLVPGGFSSFPPPAALRQVQTRLIELREDIQETINLYQGLEMPRFERETEYVCLRHPDYYSFYGGVIVSSDGESVGAEHYQDVVNEYVVPGSTAKQARWHRDSYMAGALARINNNWRQLHPQARTALETLALNPPCHNPFMNTTAQIVEMVHCLENSVELIEEILREQLDDEDVPKITLRAGQGVGVVEAPRGLLIHDYAYDDQGHCTAANCVIPTGQNLGNLNADMQAYVSQHPDMPKDELTQQLTMLVRAYDPCISCSTH